MKKASDDPIESLRERRDHLVGRLVTRVPRAKQHDVEQDLEHIRQLDEVLLMADGLVEEPRKARRRLPLMIAGLVLLAGTWFLMWKHAESGDLQLDVRSTHLSGRLADTGPSELEFGLPADTLSIEGLVGVEARGRSIVGESLLLTVADQSTEPVILRSITAPAASLVEFDASFLPRLVVTIRPAGSSTPVSVQVAVRPSETLAIDFDEAEELASEVAGTSRSALLTCQGAMGAPVSVLVDVRFSGNGTLDVLAGLSGLALGSLDFLVPEGVAVGRPLHSASALVGGTCSVAGRGEPEFELHRAAVLTADSWSGFVSSFELTPEGIHLEWLGSARNPHAGHPSDPEPLLPVLFQKWFGRSPRAYISLIVVYVSLLPIMGIFRALLGQSRFNPSLDMEEPA